MEYRRLVDIVNKVLDDDEKKKLYKKEYQEGFDACLKIICNIFNLKE